MNRVQTLIVVCSIKVCTGRKRLYIYNPLLDAVKSSHLTLIFLFQVRLIYVRIVVVAVDVRIVRKRERPIHLENVFKTRISSFSKPAKRLSSELTRKRFN